MRACSSINLAADVGKRDHLLRMLTCYNPLWLRLALESITGEAVPPGASPNDSSTLRRFLDRRVLAAPVAAHTSAEGVHPLEAAKHAALFQVGTNCGTLRCPPFALTHHPSPNSPPTNAPLLQVGAQHKAIVRRVLAIILLLDEAKGRTLLTSVSNHHHIPLSSR